MRFLLNIIWLVLSGFWLAVEYALLGLVLCIGIITIPFGLQLFKLAGYALWPFGRTTVKSPAANGLSTLGNIPWLIPGLILTLGHLLSAALLAITIIGLPLAYANLKLIPMALAPFGRQVVSNAAVTRALAAQQALQTAPSAPSVNALSGSPGAADVTVRQAR